MRSTVTGSQQPSEKAGRIGKLVAACVLLAAVSTFWVHRVYVDPPKESTVFGADLHRYFYPTAVHMHRELRRGHLPLWNPYQMAGMPFLATHISGPLYPSNLLLQSLLRPARAIEAHTLLHLLLAGALMGLFALSLGSSAVAATGAALAFVFSGAILEMILQPSYLATCAWIPGVLWAVRSLVTTASVRSALALAFVLTMAFLGGHAQALLFEAQLGIVYALAMLCFRRPGNAPRILALAAGAGVVVAGTVAAQLLPTLEMVGELPRANEGIALSDAALLQIRPGAIWDGLFGNSPLSFVVPALAAPLLLIGFFDAPRRLHWAFFATAALFTALFAMGLSTPIFPMYHALPGGDLFRGPARIAFVYAFCVAMLVGFGIDGARALLSRMRPQSTALGLGVAVVLVAIVVGDLYARSQLQSRMPIHIGESRGAPTELIDALTLRAQNDRVFIENFGGHYAAPLPHLIGMMNELFAVPTYEPMIPGAYTRYFEQDAAWRGYTNVVKSRGPKFPFTRIAGVEDITPDVLRRRLDLMSVRYYATENFVARRRLSELAAFVGAPARSLGSGRLLIRDEAVPRTYIVHDVLVEPDAKRALALLDSARFDPLHSVVAAAPIEGVDAAGAGGERAAITHYAAEEVRIDAECSAPCLLVLTDFHYPGWVVTVDGEPAAIHRVNTVFRGISLEPGTHEVVYRYTPLSFRVGAAISVSTIALVIGGAAASRWRTR